MSFQVGSYVMKAKEAARVNRLIIKLIVFPQMSHHTMPLCFISHNCTVPPYGCSANFILKHLLATHPPDHTKPRQSTSSNRLLAPDLPSLTLLLQLKLDINVD